jgi:hypothetical protein
LLVFLSFSVSTGGVCKDGLQDRVLLRSREKFADPDDLLESLIFADLKDDLFGARELLRREAVTPVYKKRDIGVPGSERRSRHLVERSPRKSKGSRFVECASRKTQKAST